MSFHQLRGTRRKPELNPILVDLMWKLGVLMTMLGFGLFCVWVASKLTEMGW